MNIFKPLMSALINATVTNISKVPCMLSINTNDIILSQAAENKQDAIKSIANGLLNKGYVEGGYVNGMLAREA